MRDRIADFQKILQEKDSIISYQRNAIQDLESNVAIKKAEVNELQGELKEMDDILNILDNKFWIPKIKKSYQKWVSFIH